MKKERIDLIDAVRGFAVLLMVIHHFLFDLVAFLGAPATLFSNPVFDILHYIFAGLFIFISGLSSDFSKSNVKRGLKTLAVAAVITLVTWLIGMPDWFGILHLMGSCMLIFGLTRKFWEKLPEAVMPILCLVLLVGTAILTSKVSVKTNWLFPLGFYNDSFASSDYFPLFPWIFVFLLGTWAGKYVKAKRLPVWFYETKVPFFPKVGRKALLIYIIHQPILVGITILIGLIFKIPMNIF